MFPPGLAWIRQWCREVVPTVDNNLAQSLMRLLDCFLEPFQEVDGSPPPDEKVGSISRALPVSK